MMETTLSRGSQMRELVKQPALLCLVAMHGPGAAKKPGVAVAAAAGSNSIPNVSRKQQLRCWNAVQQLCTGQQCWARSHYCVSCCLTDSTSAADVMVGCTKWHNILLA